MDRTPNLINAPERPRFAANGRRLAGKIAGGQAAPSVCTNPTGFEGSSESPEPDAGQQFAPAKKSGAITVPEKAKVMLRAAPELFEAGWASGFIVCPRGI
jgi:hypothetical protein